MNVANKLVTCGLAALLACGLAACSHQIGSASASAPAGSAVAATGTLKITGYGPTDTKAGVVFNKQPNGGAAMWFRMNQSMVGDGVSVEFNGTSLPADISGNLVTVSIPAKLYAAAGTYEVRVMARTPNGPERSNTVTFTAK